MGALDKIDSHQEVVREERDQAAAGPHVAREQELREEDLDALSPQMELSLALLVVLAVAAWRVRTRARWVTFAAGWALVALVPRLVIQTPRSYLNEHQFYLPLLGLLLGCAAGADALRHRALAH